MRDILQGVDSTLMCGVGKENYTPEGRVKRGLFRTSLGLLNADVNAVRNYLKKLGKFDLFNALGRLVRVRIFKSISVSSLYA